MSNYGQKYTRQNAPNYSHGFSHNPTWTPKNNQNQGQAPRKHSGAKKTIYLNKDGAEKHLTSGWKLNKSRELIAVKCITTKATKLSSKGWFGSVACTFTNTTTGEVNFHWGTMEKSTGKVVIDKIAHVLNPRAKNGGYCGTYLGK